MSIKKLDSLKTKDLKLRACRRQAKNRSLTNKEDLEKIYKKFQLKLYTY